eukprot:1161112-Pelagomonas_calceolata.AAC.4
MGLTGLACSVIRAASTCAAAKHKNNARPSLLRLLPTHSQPLQLGGQVLPPEQATPPAVHVVGRGTPPHDRPHEPGAHAAREVVLEMFEGEDDFYMITKRSEFEVFVRIVELPVADKLRDLRCVPVPGSSMSLWGRMLGIFC